MLSRSGQTNHFKDVKVPMTQAERIIGKFGGVPALVKALRNAGRSRHRSNVHRWTWPKEKGGSGGIIPTSALGDIIEAARMEGVLLTTEDFDPRVKFKNERVYLEDEFNVENEA